MSEIEIRELSDRELMSAHVAGASQAFSDLVSRHKDRLWSVSVRTTGDPEEAADALQDALISAFRRARLLFPISPPPLSQLASSPFPAPRLPFPNAPSVTMLSTIIRKRCPQVREDRDKCLSSPTTVRIS